MPTQRMAFHFVDEVAADPAWWRSWVEALPPELRQHECGGRLVDRVEMGERRPLVWVDAPFPDRQRSAKTRRDDELESLAGVRRLVERLREHCYKTGRAVRVLLDGRGVGAVVETGPDQALLAKLDEWQTIAEARPLDELRSFRTGYASLWAGVTSRERIDRLVSGGSAAAPEWTVGDEGVPINDFARALGVTWYPTHNHDVTDVEAPRPLRELVGALLASESLLLAIPADKLDRPVTGVIALYESDFSNRPADALGHGLVFVGAYPYKYNAIADEDDRFDAIEE